MVRASLSPAERAISGSIDRARRIGDSMVEWADVLSFIPLRPGLQHPLRDAWDAIDPDVVRVAAAFSTESGASELRSRIIGPAQFDAADKRF